MRRDDYYSVPIIVAASLIISVTLTVKIYNAVKQRVNSAMSAMEVRFNNEAENMGIGDLFSENLDAIEIKSEKPPPEAGYGLLAQLSSEANKDPPAKETAENTQKNNIIIEKLDVLAVKTAEWIGTAVHTVSYCERRLYDLTEDILPGFGIAETY